MVGRSLIAVTVVAILRAGPMLALSEVICTGDCNYDRTPRMDELVTGVNIALGSALLAACVGFDPDVDGQVTIDELLAGVRNALNG